jgi:predicted phage terminase large subunit-like protein
MADFTDQELLAELTRRQRALSSLGAFREWMSVTGHSDFIHPHEDHHRVMAEALEMVASGKVKRLMLCLPPGSAKSTICSVQFACWWWAKNPTHHILRCSATQSLAEKFARRCRSAVMERQFKLLSGTTIDPQNQSVSHFSNLKGGSMTAAGVGSSIIGLRSNLSILDDPVSSFEAVNSETQRTAALEWYRSEYRSRLIPGAPEIIVSTRWHTDDIPGAILKSEERDTWHTIRIPMLADSEDDPLGRQLNEQLWPEWFTEQMVLEAQRDPLRWAGMYQQVPLTSEGDWLSPEDLPLTGKPALHDVGLYCALDIALSEGKGDYTCAVVAGMSSDGTLHIIDMWKDRVSLDQIIENLIRLHRQYNFREILIDDDNSSKVFRSLAHKIFREQNTIVPLSFMPLAGKDKETRAASFRGLAKMGCVAMSHGPWNADLWRECTEFPFGAHDDAIDCLSLLGRRAAKMSSMTHTPKKSYEPPVGAITLDANGRMHTTATLGEMFQDYKPLNAGGRL